MNRMQNFAAMITALVVATAGASPILWPVNGHYYEVVETPVAWATARDQAASMSRQGMPGHLVTVTSQAENVFLTTRFSPGYLDGKWLGGYQAAGSAEPSGGWAWITGEAFLFPGWAPGEPNNLDVGNENAIIFAHPEQPWGKPWNDAMDVNTGSGFIVEYQAVPEPATMAVPLLAVAFAARRVRKSPVSI